MSNIQTGADRMPHDLSHLGFLAGQIGRLITISTTPVIAGDSFEMDAVGALRLSPLRRGLAIFFFQAEVGIRVRNVTGVQTCALPIWLVVPELLQEDVNGERIAREVRPLLEPAERERVRRELAEVTRKLGQPGASRRAAEAIMS